MKKFLMAKLVGLVLVGQVRHRLGVVESLPGPGILREPREGPSEIELDVVPDDGVGVLKDAP